ncbi:MAG TPA: hypothetical protein VF974_07210 [Patescibacteria group bacterium]
MKERSRNWMHPYILNYLEQVKDAVGLESLKRGDYLLVRRRLFYDAQKLERSQSRVDQVKAEILKEWSNSL